MRCGGISLGLGLKDQPVERPLAAGGGPCGHTWLFWNGGSAEGLALSPACREQGGPAWRSWVPSPPRPTPLKLLRSRRYSLDCFPTERALVPRLHRCPPSVPEDRQGGVCLNPAPALCGGAFLTRPPCFPQVT